MHTTPQHDATPENETFTETDIETTSPESTWTRAQRGLAHAMPRLRQIALYALLVTPAIPDSANW